MFRLAIKVIKGSGFRSLAIFAAVAGVAAFLVATTLVIAGAQKSLDSGLNRLGADILVVPAGTETQMDTALLIGRPLSTWMPRENTEKVKAVPGVEKISPQIYLASIYGSPNCSAPEMYVVVYDPATDFTITPWLDKNLARPLTKGEVIGGNLIKVQGSTDNFSLNGYRVSLVGNLEPTGTGIDRTVFMTLETGMAMVKTAPEKTALPASAGRNSNSGVSSFENNISTIMVKTSPGADVHGVAVKIQDSTNGMASIESLQLFGTFRSQMNGILWGFFAITLIVWAIAVVLIGVVFSIAANERQREMAVLRAVGATRNFIFKSLLTEAGLIALGGSITGIIVSAAGLFILRDVIAGSLQMPFLFPSISSFLGLFSAGVALAIISIALSALFPAYRLSRQDLAITMRE